MSPCMHVSCCPIYQANRVVHVDRYLEQLKHSKVKGYLFEQQNITPKS